MSCSRLWNDSLVRFVLAFFACPLVVSPAVAADVSPNSGPAAASQVISATQAAEEAPPADAVPGWSPPTDVPSVQQALAAKTDLWGELAMRQPGGPTYAFFERLLPPLRYVDAALGPYPVPLAAPFAAVKARLLSNGSGVNVSSFASPAERWSQFPLGATFHVGPHDELFGADPRRLTGPSYENGYLPLTTLQYRLSGATLQQQVFVPTAAPFADGGVIIIRFTSVGKGSQPSRLRVRLQTAEGQLTHHGHTLLNTAGQMLAWLGPGWSFDAAAPQLTGELQPGHSLALAIASAPLADSKPGPLDEPTLSDLRRQTSAAWHDQLARCMQLDVPEVVVNHAWKTVVIANLMMATRDEMSYSAGNLYARLYEAECGDAVRALLTFGRLDAAQAMTAPLLTYRQPGLDYHDAGFKLQLLSHVYWITRDAQYIRTQRTLWRPIVDRILNDRQPSDGLLPKEDYAGDIKTQVSSLNSNANSWRGLRDIVAVLRDIGERNEAEQLAAEAARFRAAILSAIDKSEFRDTQPPFIPIALFGAEQPYDPITANVAGSYWNLLIPYVLGSGILSDERTRATIDYLHQHGGIALGMIRFHQHSGLFANENGVDDLYTLRYVQALLKQDDVDRALVTFYGKLAQGFTRNTFIGGEGSGLIPLDVRGRGMYLPPNASGNALFLTTLRELLVQDHDLDNDGAPDTLRLLFATPPAWLADGKSIVLQNAPTAFGPVSIVAKSTLSQQELIVDVKPPSRAPQTTLLRLRLPPGYTLRSAAVGSQPVAIGRQNTLDISHYRKPVQLRCKVASE